MLRHISGFLPADAGTIEVFGRVAQSDGRVAHNIRELRADIGFVFQQFNLVGRLSVLTNVLTGLLFRVPLWRSLLARFTPGERKAAFRELAAVGILEQAYQRASELSGGQQQRAALARTLVQGARIILADEPIASLDPESSRNVMDILARMNRERGLARCWCRCIRSISPFATVRAPSRCTRASSSMTGRRATSTLRRCEKFTGQPPKSCSPRRPKSRRRRRRSIPELPLRAPPRERLFA